MSCFGGEVERLKRPAEGEELFFASGGRRLVAGVGCGGSAVAGGPDLPWDWGDGGALERGAGLSGGTPGGVDGLQLLGVWEERGDNPRGTLRRGFCVGI